MSVTSHWDVLFWRGATLFTVTETIIFPFFFVNKQPIFLSQWPFSLFAKTCLSDRIFPEIFFASSGWLIYELHLGILFLLKKVSKTLLSSVFQTVFWVKKEFPNVTHKLISPPQAKKFWVKIRSLRQVFATKRENGHWDRKIGCLFKKKNEKIIVSVTVNSVAPLQKNMSQWQTFGEMKLKIKKTKKTKTIHNFNFCKI